MCIVNITPRGTRAVEWTWSTAYPAHPLPRVRCSSVRRKSASLVPEQRLLEPVEGTDVCALDTETADTPSGGTRTCWFPGNRR